MYHVLRCLMPQNSKGEALMKISNAIEVGSVWNWRDGMALQPDELPVPTPIVIPYRPLRGYPGPPVEFLDVSVPLMSARLAQAIVEAGVDNIELFPAVLRDAAGGVEYDYKAFKVVGLVAAADMRQSKWSSYDGNLVADVAFDKLVIDEKKARGLLMFRLAEKLSALLVHQRVRDRILANGIDTVDFVAPEDWAHL
jgi:hypothetical protein